MVLKILNNFFRYDPFFHSVYLRIVLHIFYPKNTLITLFNCKRKMIVLSESVIKQAIDSPLFSPDGCKSVLQSFSPILVIFCPFFVIYDRSADIFHMAVSIRLKYGNFEHNFDK